MDAEWFLRRLRDEGWRPADLWCRRNPGGPILAAALMSQHPGRTATLTVGPCRNPAQVGDATALLRDLIADLTRHGEIALLQGMTDAEDALAAAPLKEAGFVDLAVLACMERANARQHVEPAIPGGCSIGTESAADDLGALLRATYEDTLDCPGLAELRRDEDILEGHRRGGRYDPLLWTVLKVDGRDAGAALLNRLPAGGSVELTYLGLAKWARGRGLGSLLLDVALAKAATAPERTISLAVDERNAPAERLYRSRGFRTISRRRAFAMRIDSST